jgi:hypothetical protein
MEVLATVFKAKKVTNLYLIKICKNKKKSILL